MGYRRTRTNLGYALKRRKKPSARLGLSKEWKPVRFGLCPVCEAEERKKRPPPPQPLEPPKGKPPKIVEIEPTAPKTRAPPQEKPTKKPSEEKKKPGKPTEPEKPEKPKLPFNIRPEDVEKAKKASEQVEKEFEKAQTVKVDKTTPMFQPVASIGAPSQYRDRAFMSKMETALKEWRTGYETEVGRTGVRFKVKEYIRTREEKPFITRRLKSAKGRKILVVADFSGSMEDMEEQYKKAIVSAMEVLDSIGTETALFGFGGEKGGSPYSFFFKIKKFDEPKWKPIHSAKVAGLRTAGFTPTHQAYIGLENYIRKQRPDVVLTITDGSPDSKVETERMVKKLKKYSRMVAFSIGQNRAEAEGLRNNLKRFGYHKVFAVSSMNKLPKNLVDLIAPT